jgi:ATP adenylyltransferase/5',5'''-P-1,P-4-tetraphosphate phosphorylase II
MKSELEDLFESQVRDWPMLARGVQGLAEAETRRVRIDWFDVFVRHIPHRIASTIAAVDKASVEKRPCFLCPANLPKEEKGIRLNADYSAYFNPFPILDGHLTIVHREHHPQRIAGQLEAMLNLAKTLADCFVIYNGPECGASAPDHLHFQAASRRLLPIQNDVRMANGLSIPRYSRNVLVFRDSDGLALVDRLRSAVAALGSVTGTTPEPLLNIAAYYETGQWTVFVFPRSKHRPTVFHTGEFTVSPASIDLCGVFVVPVEGDFRRITGDDVHSIFREVTLADAVFEDVLERLQ